MTNGAISVTCDVVGCDQPTTGHYLHLRQDQALDFNVCAPHFDRIEGGEMPEVVAERHDLAALDGRPALVMDAD